MPCWKVSDAYINSENHNLTSVNPSYRKASTVKIFLSTYFHYCYIIIEMWVSSEHFIREKLNK